MMFKDKYIHKLYAFALAAVFALTLAGCGGGGGSATAPPDPPPVAVPTPYETALEAITAAATPEAAQAAYDAVKGDVTAAEGDRLQMAVNDRQAELAMMARAGEQKMNLMAAAGAIDTSELTDAAAIAAANTAIAALRAALAAAADVSDADKAMYEGQVTAAENAVAAAQSSLDHAAQTMVLDSAVEARRAIDLSSLSTQADIDAAGVAIAALQTALDNATELSATEKTAATIELMAANRAVASAQGRTDIEVQRMALSDAAATLGAIDLTDLSTQEKIDAAEAAIIALDLALAAATGLTDAEKLDATVNVTVAKRRLASAKETLTANVDTQKTALADAAGMLDTSDLSTQELVDAANAAIRNLRQALEDAVNIADKSMYQSMLDNAIAAVDEAQGGIDTATRRMNQMAALSGASGTLQAALTALSGSTPTQEQLDTANSAVTGLNEAIAAGADLTEAEKATYVREAANAAAPISAAQMAFDDAEAEAEEATDMAMMATAKKLYDGISTPSGNPDSPAATDRAAGYNAAGTAIMVSIGNGTDTPAPVSLSEDEDATVAANHGWEGKKYTAAPGDDGTYEAVVYSNVGDSTEGAKFSTTYPYDATSVDGTNTELTIDTSTAEVAGRVASPRFDQSAGKKEFELPTNTLRVMIPGSYHGVSGTYYCTPGTNMDCSATVAESGFTLAGGTWTFKATNAETRLMDVADAIYASYGWWIHKSADGNTFTASAFVDDRGAVPVASGITVLRGTATYMGGAAGKYALYSATGGTNDAGHFTARATLNANFNDDTISGTIDNFMGADGQSRNWSVELKKSGISDAGAIAGDGTAGNTDLQMTVWSIDETAAGAAGEWSGDLKDNGDDDVPKIATGTFRSMYSTSGEMVGAFGVNKQ